MASDVPEAIEDGDVLVLWRPDGRRYLVRASRTVEKVAGLGVVRLENFIGVPWGSQVVLGDVPFRLLRPVLTDQLAALDRRAQIVLPKDAARILLECSIGPGCRVAEAGVGSAGLTLVLAHAVGDTGRILGFDVRGDHLRVARINLERAQLLARVDLVEGDIVERLATDELDAIVLDVPDPERVLPAVAQRLALGGSVACYTPLVSQMERARVAMAEGGFAEVRSMELIERQWTSHERGSRPDGPMLAHTGFLTFGRRVGAASGRTHFDAPK